MTQLPFALWEPQFQAFCIGLPKTGTTSMARMFKGYRSGHELWFAETATHIMKFHRGLMDRDTLEAFLIRRVDQNGLEMDSASFNHLYLDLLVKNLPKARFILTLRDFKPWFNSYLQMLLLWRRRFSENQSVPRWQTEYGKFLFGAFDPEDFISQEVLLDRLDPMVENFFRYWVQAHRNLLRFMDPERTLVLRTDRISDSVDRIAAFLHIPSHSLARKESHSNRRRMPLSLTGSLGPGYLERYTDLTLFPDIEKLFVKARESG